MTINKFQGKTEEEALEKAKSEMGQGVVIMNVKVVKPKGLFGFMKTPWRNGRSRKRQSPHMSTEPLI